MATVLFASMWRAFAVTAILLLLMFSVMGETLPPGSMPDLAKTPGATQPAAVRTTDKHLICTQKTSTIRNVSSATKKKVFALYGITNKTGWCATKGCEVDHVCSLELGCNNDISNLFPQTYAGKWNARIKDKLENRLHKLICDGTMTPKDAQECISENWTDCYKKWMVDSGK